MEKKQKKVASMNLIEKEDAGDEKLCCGPVIYNPGPGYMNEKLERQSVWGWENAMAAASDIWSSIHCKLLEGNLVFALKNTTPGDLSQLVVVRNISTRDFAIGVVTSGFSMLLPHVPFEYVQTQVVDDLKKYKIDKNIIETYKQIIEDETASN